MCCGIKWAFPVHLILNDILVPYKIKMKKMRHNNLKSIRVSSPNYDLFNHDTFNQPQAVATSSLNGADMAEGAERVDDSAACFMHAANSWL